MTLAELLPCPGCGAPAYASEAIKVGYLRCRDACGFEVRGSSAQSAITAWNTRAALRPQALPEDVRALVERLHYAMKHIAFDAHRENALKVMSEAGIMLTTQQAAIQRLTREVEKRVDKASAWDAATTIPRKTQAEIATLRADLDEAVRVIQQVEAAPYSGWTIAQAVCAAFLAKHGRAA